MIEQDLGADSSTGARLRRLYEVTTYPEDYPMLSETDVEDLHAALVELERLDFPTRQAARARLGRAGDGPDDPAAIRRAIFVAARERVFH
jgi:hypothetical protein